MCSQGKTVTLREQLVETEEGLFIELFYDDRKLLDSLSNLRFRFKKHGVTAVEPTLFAYGVVGKTATFYVETEKSGYLIKSSIVTGYVEEVISLGKIEEQQHYSIKRVRDINLIDTVRGEDTEEKEN